MTTRPEYYQTNGIDRIGIWALTYSEVEFRATMKSHIDKYVARYEHKNGIEDLDKAIEYINRLKAWENNL